LAEKEQAHVHELGITESLVGIAERAARDQGATRVLSLTVEIGALSGVVPDAVAFCFEACARGTLLEGSRLDIRAIPGRALCADCGADVDIDNLTYACPICGSYALQRTQGEELRLLEVEIE